jgi:hypothetical protein
MNRDRYIPSTEIHTDTFHFSHYNLKSTRLHDIIRIHKLVS